jgi:hypothetical protein
MGRWSSAIVFSLRFSVSSFVFRILSFVLRISSFVFRISSFVLRISSFVLRISSVGFNSTYGYSIHHRFTGTIYLVSQFKVVDELPGQTDFKNLFTQIPRFLPNGKLKTVNSILTTEATPLPQPPPLPERYSLSESKSDNLPQPFRRSYANPGLSRE